MIQATNITSMKGQQGAVKTDSQVATESDGAINQEFSAELAASLGLAASTQTANVETNPELLLEDANLSLNSIKNQEIAQPKIFDQDLIKNVEKINQPQAQMMNPLGQQDLQLLKEMDKDFSKNEQINQLLSKNIKANQLDRSPAIDFGKDEIDPKLLNLEDFVKQKNLVNKKIVSENAYGLKSEINKKMGLNSESQITELKNDFLQADMSQGKSVNSQQFILDIMKENNSNGRMDVQGNQKVLNFSDIKSADSNQIMSQITDYIVQAKASKESTVTVRVNHDELGLLDITVRKAQGMSQENLAINIGTHTQDGKNFFQQNSKELFSHLNQAGLSISDLKVETSSNSAKNEFDMGQQNRNQSFGDKNFSSEQNQKRHDQNRRQDLWNILKDKDVA
jgi:hypothetical protein